MSWGVVWVRCRITERRETVIELELPHNCCLVVRSPGDAYLVGASIWGPVARAW